VHERAARKANNSDESNGNTELEKGKTENNELAPVRQPIDVGGRGRIHFFFGLYQQPFGMCLRLHIFSPHFTRSLGQPVVVQREAKGWRYICRCMQNFTEAEGTRAYVWVDTLGYVQIQKQKNKPGKQSTIPTSQRDSGSENTISIQRPGVPDLV